MTFDISDDVQVGVKIVSPPSSNLCWGETGP